MQLGMIGLGRMGANIVRRLMRDGHQCVVFDVSPTRCKTLDARRRVRRDDARGVRRQADGAAGGLGDDPGTASPGKVVEQLAESDRAGDIIIDGGNSNYRDDVDRRRR